MHPAPLVRGAWALAACLLPWPALAAPLTADEVVRHALETHPDVVAARARVQVAEAQRREVAVFLANPEIQGGAPVLGDLIQGQVTQPVSLTGEGWHARRAAALARDEAALLERRTTLVLAAEVRTAWIRAVQASRRAHIADEALGLASQLRAAAEAREAAGEGSALETRLARLEEARAVAASLEAGRGALEARTALAAYHPDGATAELADDLDLPPTSGAAGERSDVAAARVAVDAGQAELKRAKAAALPLVGVGAFAQRDAGEWDVQPYVGVELPIWNRNQSGIAGARRDLAVAQAQSSRLAAVAEAERTGSTALARRAADDLSRLGDPTRDAHDALAAIGSALERGEIDVSTGVLLRSQVLTGWSAAVEAEQSAAEVLLAARLANEDPSLLEVTP